MIFGEGAPSPSYWHPGDCCNRMQLSLLDDVNLLRISYDLLCSVAFIWYQLVSCTWHHLYGINCILSILIVYNLNDLLLPSALNPELFTGTFNEDTSIYILHKFESIIWKPLLGADYPSSEHKHFITSFWKISKVYGIGTVPHVQRLYFAPGFPRPIKPIKLITLSIKGGLICSLGFDEVNSLGFDRVDYVWYRNPSASVPDMFHVQVALEIPGGGNGKFRSKPGQQTAVGWLVDGFAGWFGILEGCRLLNGEGFKG